MSDALMDLQAHYKAVRARLNAGPPKPPPALPKPTEEAQTRSEPEQLKIIPPLTFLGMYPTAVQRLKGLRCPVEVKEKLLPILEKHRIPWAEAVGKSQKAPCVKVRLEIYAKLNAHGWSLSQIGRLCGDRDHTTVLSGIQRVVKMNLSEVELGMCKDLGMRPVDYYDAKMTLRAWRGQQTHADTLNTSAERVKKTGES
jgi:hypothetical protein